jgi:hypothetical protein
MVASMAQSIRRSPDSAEAAPSAERRRLVRQKLHSPVYASFNGPETGMVVDLSELLDLNEDGFAVQTGERLEMNRVVTLCLDLPETRSYIHGSGQVIWSDDAGRGGIRFSALPESSRRILKEWIFTNLLIGCSNHAARTEQLARRQEEQLPGPETAKPASAAVPAFDRSETPSSMETVRREVGGGFDAALQFVAERALGLTEASGAALAFLTGGSMICRARAGGPAPPLGAPVDVRQGLSGECVGSGQLVYCEDVENDPRVDPEVCRALGIGSLMAVPIVSDFRVAGLLEVFSPHPCAFTRVHGTILERLVEMIPNARCENSQRESAQSETAQDENTQDESARDHETQAEAPIRTEAVPGASQSSALQPGSIPLGPVDLSSADLSSVDLSSSNLSSVDLISTQAPRQAFQEPQPEVRERVSPPVRARAVSAQVRAQDPRAIPKPTLKARSRWYQHGLFWLSAAVISLALGYLTGPLVDRHWGNELQAAQRRLFEAFETKAVKAKAVEETAIVSVPRAVEQRPQAKSLSELRMLAGRGDADAQWQMGVRYHNGEDVPQDDAQAVQWFLRAAEQGHVTAQATLGAYYWAGRGVPPNLSRAYFWSAIALAQGDDNSKSRLEGLASQMTREQVSAARQQAEIWVRQHNSVKSAKN